MINHSEPNYVTFDKKTAVILKIILDAQRSGNPIYRNDIAKKMNISKTWAGNIIARLESDSRKFLVSKNHLTGVKRRPSQSIEIDLHKIVSRPLTAWITLKLQKECSSQEGYEIKRHEFESKIVNELKKINYQDTEIEKTVNQKLEFLIRVGDVELGKEDKTFIWFNHSRFLQQKEFIKLLIKDADLPKIEN